MRSRLLPLGRSLSGIGLMLLIGAASPAIAAESLVRLVEAAEYATEADNYSQAEQLWREVVSLDPNHAEGYRQLGDVLREQNSLT
jgi:tetratricopeptide (TPR) repeat protein